MRTTLLCLFLFGLTVPAVAQNPENVFVVVIDGLRDAEGFARGGTYLPHIWNDLRPLGTINRSFWNRGWTATTSGHLTLLSGVRQVLRNNGGAEQEIRSFDPTLFEYYRRHFGAPESACGIFIGKTGNVGQVADHSLEPAYGQQFRGCQVGDATTHDDTASSRLVHEAMDSFQPHLLMLNLADVDAAGHAGIYADYLDAIRVADSCIWEIWKHIQAIPPYTDTHYRDKTVLFVVNDHGRNDDAHGGFFNHGEWDHGSRKIMFLAAGPGIPAGQEAPLTRDQIDIAPTVGRMLGFPTPFCEGRVMNELLAGGSDRPVMPHDAGPPAPLALNISNTGGFARDPDVCADRDGDIYCVWSDSAPGHWSVRLRKSSDDGRTWSAAQELFDFPAEESTVWYCRVAADDSVAVAGIGPARHRNPVDSLDPNVLDTTFLWYPWLATSTDGGANWSYSSLPDSNMGSYYPPVAVHDGRYSIGWWTCGQFAWQDPRNGLFFNHRDPAGAWQPLPVEVNGRQSIHVALADDGDNFHLAASAYRSQDFDIGYSRSVDGSNWNTTWIVQDPDGAPVYDYDAEMVVDDLGIVHVFWARKPNTGGTWQLMYGRRDTLTGAFDTLRLTDSPAGAWQPHCAARADTLALVWIDYRHGNPELYYRFSTDRGLGWSEPERLTWSDALTHHPRVTATRRGFYVVWQDLSSGNWEIYGRELDTYAGRDVGATVLEAPTGMIETMLGVVPRARLQNFGSMTATFETGLMIVDSLGVPVYEATAVVDDLAPGTSVTCSFDAWPGPHEPGSYTATCFTSCPGDSSPGNDTARAGFAVIPTRTGWVEVARMPEAPSSQPVKSGGWLAPGPGGALFAAKGYKTPDCYRYDPLGDSWVLLAPIPEGVEGRLPDKGCRGVWDGDRCLFMTKGKNTLGFWRYDMLLNSWQQLADVPEGPSGKKVKGGTDLAHVVINDTGWVYLLKGYRTEFYRYNTVTGVWETLRDLPWGYKDRWDKGSWLAHDGGDYIYAHQAKYYDRTAERHYLFRYDVLADSFTELTGMPLWGLHGGRLRKKKAKDGGAGAWVDGRLFALKGGNTQQFFTYDCAGDSWTELDTVPTVGTTGRRKRVKYGADLAWWDGGAFYALKGNKTVEFWRYIEPAIVDCQRPASEMAGQAGSPVHGISLAPNPLAGGFVILLHSLPKAGAASVRVFDVTGRTVLSRSVVAMRRGSVSLDVRDLAAGTYLVRLESDGCVSTSKLVIQK